MSTHDESETEQEATYRLPAWRQHRPGQWWRAREQGLSSGLSVIEACNEIRPHHEAVVERIRMAARAYGCDAALFGTTLRDAATGDPVSRAPTNVLANIIDSLQSDVYKERLTSAFVTDRGSWKMQRVARDMGDFLTGVDQECEADVQMLLLGLHVLLFGIGILKGVETQDERVSFEVVPRWQLRVNPIDARYGKPRAIYHKYSIDRGMVFEMYARESCKELAHSRKTRERAIDLAIYDRESWDDPSDSDCDRITLIEAYHLPSGPGANDGRLVLTTVGDGDSPELMDCPWEHSWMPYRWLWGNVPLAGIDPESVASRLLPNHYELAFLDRRLRDGHADISLPRVWMRRGATPMIGHVNDAAGSILMSEEPPQVLNWTPFAADMYQHRQSIKQEMYEISGSNQLTANGQLPAGMARASGVALQQYADQYTQRHATKFRLREAFEVARAEMALDMAEDIYQRKGEYKVQLASNYGVREIEWGEIREYRDKCVIRIYSASALPKQPAARLDAIMQLMQGGVLEPWVARKQLADTLDLKGALDSMNAPVAVIEETLFRMVDEGEAFSPEPFDNLELARAVAMSFYATIRLARDVDVSRKALVMQFIEEVKLLLDKKNAQAAPPPGAAPQMPPADPAMMGAAA